MAVDLYISCNQREPNEGTIQITNHAFTHVTFSVKVIIFLYSITGGRSLCLGERNCLKNSNRNWIIIHLWFAMDNNGVKTPF